MASTQVQLPFKIIGTGMYLPRKVFLSTEVDQLLNWKSGTAEEKFKVKSRHFAEGDETVSMMGASALQDALKDSGLKISDIDLIISASASKEQPIPYLGSLIQRNLGSSAYGIPCFDVDTTCLSFVTAIHIAAHFLAAKTYRRIAVVSSELASVAINWKNPEVCTLFGDGAGAFILETDTTAQSGIVSYALETYSEGWKFCEIAAGATKLNIRKPPKNDDEYLFSMNGKAAFKLSAEKMPKMLHKMLNESGLTFKELDLVVPHQASPLALAHMQSRLDIPAEKFVNQLEIRGNQVSASIPIAFHEAKIQNRIKPGHHVLLAGTSAGISMGAMILKI